MHQIIAASLLAAGLISGAALAADAAPAAKQDKPVPAMILGGAIKSEAEVIAIDLKTRKVTLKGEDGGVQEIIVGKDARNLPQVKVGDRVVTEYSQILAIKLKKGAAIDVRGILNENSWIGLAYLANASSATLVFVSFDRVGLPVLLAAMPIIALFLFTINARFRRFDTV